MFLALLAALLLASPARAADPNEILRDCFDDGALQGDYTPSELRGARTAMPTDVDEYSDCRDVLSRALSDATASSNGGNPTDSGDAGGATGGTSGTGGGSQPSAGDPGAASGSPPAAADVQTAPASPQDYAAMNSATEHGDAPVKLSGRDVSPLLAAQVGRNGLPGTLVAVLALLGAAALASGVALVRRRGVAHA